MSAATAWDDVLKSVQNPKPRTLAGKRLRCSFCGISADDCAILIAGDKALICENCCRTCAAVCACREGLSEADFVEMADRIFGPFHPPSPRKMTAADIGLEE